MIITKLKGGLGNQMFQYACGKALSLRNKDTLKLDISGYKSQGSDTPRYYSLSHFKIKNEAIATDAEIAKIKYPLGVLSKALLFANLFVKTKIFRDFNIGWHKNIATKTGDVYLDGFWQTEKYFADVSGDIRNEFSLKEGLAGNSLTMATAIAGNAHVPSVSMHVRRGDVARDAATNPYFGCTPPEYYARALEYIAAHVKEFHVFVFSDDIEWVKKNITIPYPVTYVSGSGAGNQIPDYEELTLMSMCAHNIIANSSFSWWGAWLNPRNDKIVIAPKEWIKRGKRMHKDTVPNTWMQL